MTDEKELKDQRIPIMMTASEVEAIDDWMFKNRIRSRGEAIRRLCQMGIVANERADSANSILQEALVEHATEYSNVLHLLDEMAAKGGATAEDVFALLNEALNSAGGMIDKSEKAQLELAAIRAFATIFTKEKFAGIDIARFGENMRSALKLSLERAKERFLSDLDE